MNSRWMLTTTLMGVWLLAGSAWADVVVERNSQRTEGVVEKIDAQGVLIKLAQGSVTIPLGNLASVEIPRPAALDQGIAHLTDGKFGEAATVFRSLIDRYTMTRIPGLTWMTEAILGYGDALLGENKIDQAQRVYEAFEKNFGAAKEIAVKKAKIHVVQKNYDTARPILEEFVQPLLKVEWLTSAQESLLAEALLLLGDCQRAKSQWNEALDSYLLVVALFDSDANRALEARFKAGEMFAKLNNKARAIGCFEDVIRDAPESGLAAQARQQLAKLKS